MLFLWKYTQHLEVRYLAPWVMIPIFLKSFLNYHLQFPVRPPYFFIKYMKKIILGICLILFPLFWIYLNQYPYLLWLEIIQNPILIENDWHTKWKRYVHIWERNVFFFVFFFAKWGENDGILAFQSQEFWYKSKILEYYCKILWFCQCKLFSIICIFIYIFFSYTYYSTDLFFSSFSKLSLNIYLAHMLCKEKNKVLGKLAKIKQIFCYSRSTKLHLQWMCKVFFRIVW